jgi:hypothetical protein
MAHKEELMKEIEHQLDLGEEDHLHIDVVGTAEGLAEEDMFQLECNFDELATTNGEQQEYWILAIQAAREACRLWATARGSSQRCGHGTTDG